MVHESDAFAVGQGEELVIVHHRVHVLHPHRVDVSVEHDPPNLVASRRQRLAQGSKVVGEDAVGPVSGLRVHLSVELSHGLRLGVDDVDLGVPPHLGLRPGEGVDDDGLTAAGVTNHHRGVTRQHGLVQLHNLVNLLRRVHHHLVPVLLQVTLDDVVELRVPHPGAVEPGEKVGDEPHEQGNVVKDKLGQVHVAERAHQHDTLVEVRGAALQCTRHDEHGLERTKAEVVVELLGELLFGELVEHRHLLGQHPGGVETLGEEHDFANLLQVGDDHRDGTEERLEVIGELGATRVAGVHGDEVTRRGHQLHLLALEQKLGELVLQSLLDGFHLRRNHGEHLQGDAVELVEATPRAGLHQAAEDHTHRLVVQTLAAVEHHAEQGHGLGEILGGLRLARTRGSRGGGSEHVGERGGDRHVAPVGETGDDEPAVEAHVLVAKVESARALVDDDVVLVPVPTEPQLGLPGKLPRVENRVAHKVVDDVSRVHVDDDEAVHLLAVVVGQVTAHHVSEVHQLAAELVCEILHGHLVPLAHALEDVLNLPGPPNL